MTKVTVSTTREVQIKTLSNGDGFLYYGDLFIMLDAATLRVGGLGPKVFLSTIFCDRNTKVEPVDLEIYAYTKGTSKP